MNEYTASNGLRVGRHERPQLGFAIFDGGTNTLDNEFSHLNKPEMQALREFFCAEEDERLERWRWPDYPEYVVYSIGADEVIVLSDRTGITERVFRGHERRGSYLNDAARAFFDAHPEPKPAWHNAQAGEVWELTFSEDGGGGTEAWTVTPSPLRFAHPNYVSRVVLTDTTIISGRRIWPEES